jgi:hypothetical protein
VKTLLAALLILPSIALATDFGIGVGYSKYNQNEDGIWYQEPYRHDIQTKDMSLTLEVRYSVRDYLDLKFGYSHLGDIKSDALAAGDDKFYDPVRHACVGKCWDKPSRWIGSGNVQGFYLLASPKYKHIFLDVGYWAYQANFDMVIPDWHAGEFDAPKYVSVSSNNKWQTGMVLGAGVEYKNFTFGVRQYKAASSDDVFPPIYKGNTTNAYLMYRF